MKTLFFAACVGLAASTAMAGCALEPGSDTETSTSETPGNTGSVSLDLQGTTPNGTIYQLRQATFTINTTPPTTLSSDASLPDATALSTTLTEGSYLVTLQPGWLLDKVDPIFGTATPVVATLVSANPAVAFVQAGNTKNVTFQFESSGAVITTGTLAIGIGVTEVDGGTP